MRFMFFVALALLASTAARAQQCQPGQYAVFLRYCSATAASLPMGRNCVERRLGGYTSFAACDATAITTARATDPEATRAIPSGYTFDAYQCTREYRCDPKSNPAGGWQKP